MKKLLFLPLFVATLMVASCTGSKSISSYQCPMKCEGAKTYEQPGTCPVCGMELEGIESSKKQ